jgi:hypothetical protein
MLHVSWFGSSRLQEVLSGTRKGLAWREWPYLCRFALLVAHMVFPSATSWIWNFLGERILFLLCFCARCHHDLANGKGRLGAQSKQPRQYCVFSRDRSLQHALGNFQVQHHWKAQRKWHVAGFWIGLQIICACSVHCPIISVDYIEGSQIESQQLWKCKLIEGTRCGMRSQSSTDIFSVDYCYFHIQWLFENKIFLKKGPKVGKYLGIAPEILDRFGWLYRQTWSTHQEICLMNSLVSIAQIYIFEESTTFIFTRRTSTHTGIFNITGIWINNCTFPYIIRISHCSIERSHDTENASMCACSPYGNEGFTLFNHVNLSNTHWAAHETNLSGWSALCWLNLFPHYISV